MKKFGLRALAGGLALLMVAGLGAPAVAKAQDDLLILAPAKELKVLEITKDMVDEDGEIVISGGEYDRIVISKDVDAKDIYFDQVVVKDLVVESGNKATVQLWEVDADKLTVQEPEFEELTLYDLLPLLAEKETQQVALEMYLAYKKDKDDAINKAPSIITKEDAKVDTLVARANVTLDLAEGEVDVVALEASDKLERAKVTLKNYTGDVTYKGTDNFNSMTLRNVDSRINTLTVNESNANNYFTVSAQNAVVLKAEVAGNAQVSLDAPMGTVEITEAATAAQVCILNTADEMKVDADGAKVELTMNANIATATVTSDNVKVEGQGNLVEISLEGKGAYVSTEGTKVEGENTYVKPVYVERPYDSWSEDFSDATLVEGVPTDGTSMNWADYTYNAEGGYAEVWADAGWEGFTIILDNKDNGSAARFDVTFKVKKLDGTASKIRLTEMGAWSEFCDQVEVGDEWVTVTAKGINVTAGGSQNIMVASADGNSSTLKMAVDDVVVQRYTDWTEPPARPVVTENVTYTFADMAQSYNDGATPSVSNGQLTVSYSGQYKEVRFDLPEKMHTNDYNKIFIDFDSVTGSGTIAVKAFAGSTELQTAYGKTGDFEIDLTAKPGYEITKLGFMQDTTAACTAVIKSVTFVASGGDGLGDIGGDDTTGGEVAPEGGILCTPDSTNLVEFTDVDFSDLVGKTVNISVDVIRVGGTENPKAHGQFNDSVKAGDSDWFYAIHYNKEIGDEWTSFGATDFVVPEQFGDETNPVYFAIKAASGVDYSQYKIYYKNFKVVVDGEEEVPEGGTLCTPDNTNLVEFTDVDFSELVGKTVNISVDVIRVGGTENPKAHGQFNDSVKAGDSDWFYAIHYNKEIGDTWTSFGKTEFVVPEQFGDETNPVYFAIKVASGTDYSPYKIYYKNFNVEVIEEEKVTEFYVAKDVAFNDVEVINSNGNIVAQLEALNLAGDNLVNTLPAALAGEAASYKTLEGIMSKIDYFEFSVILTEGTPKEGLQDGIYWAPQAQIQAQSTNYDEGTWNLGLTQEQNATLCVNLGQATESAPKTGSGKLYTEYFEGWTSKDQYSLNMLQIQFLNAELGTFVSGTYSIKAVLK